MQYNILLVVIDCLRYDRVVPGRMPFLYEFGQQNTVFENFWSVSHSTDPVMTALLSGKWPDELRLYAMLYEYPDYSIPTDVEMLAQTAKKHGYSTGMITNVGRWYQRGVDRFVDNRGWHGANTFSHAVQMITSMQQPWFITVHDDSCHTNYRGGNYDVACGEVDTDLKHMLGFILHDKIFRDNTFIIVTADHGEGLGERGIAQHGYGLWPFLTHVPLVIYQPRTPKQISGIDRLCQHVNLYGFMKNIVETVEVTWPPGMIVSDYAHMVGRVPRFWHRGVTDGETLLIKEQAVDEDDNSLGNTFTKIDLKTGKETTFAMAGAGNGLWNAARDHAARFGIDADDGRLADDDILEQRLKALGYFE